MKILLTCVNYNSYTELKTYLQSLDKAVKKSKVQLDVIVADNSSKPEELDTSYYKNIYVQRDLWNNLGYLGGAMASIEKKHNISEYDYICISNVDIVIDSDFFSLLEKKNYDSNVMWIATSILSREESRDRNPKIMKRYTKKNLQKLLFLHRNPFIFWLYCNTLYKRKKIQKKHEPCTIYAGHGSFMLFRTNLIEGLSEKYPIFLFGEEIYFAEEIRRRGGTVYYDPSLIVYDDEHVSTSQMPKKFHSDCNIKAIEYILKKYYQYE